MKAKLQVKSKSSAVVTGSVSSRKSSPVVDNEENRKTNNAANSAVNTAEKNITVTDGKSLSDLKIEKERLETTVMLLQQKLSDKEDGDVISMKFLERKREAEKERDDFKSDNITLRS